MEDKYNLLTGKLYTNGDGAEIKALDSQIVVYMKKLNKHGLEENKRNEIKKEMNYTKNQLVNLIDKNSTLDKKDIKKQVEDDYMVRASRKNLTRLSKIFEKEN